MTGFFTTLMNTNPIQILLAVGGVLVMCSGGSSDIEEPEDENGDYENASWNPAASTTMADRKSVGRGPATATGWSLSDRPRQTSGFCYPAPGRGLQ